MFFVISNVRENTVIMNEVGCFTWTHTPKLFSSKHTNTERESEDASFRIYDNTSFDVRASLGANAVRTWRGTQEAGS